jgi:hypothetical protein
MGQGKFAGNPENQDSERCLLLEHRATIQDTQVLSALSQEGLITLAQGSR